MNSIYYSDLRHKLFAECLKGTNKINVLLIPGAYHTGACYLETPDGRPGWAYLLNKAGHNVWVTDLPGTGRSGYLPVGDVRGQFIVEAYCAFVKNIEGPVIVICHSLSGPYGFKLAELLPEKVKSVIAIEPGLLGDIQDIAKPELENENEVVLKFKGFDFKIDLHNRSAPTEAVINRLSKNNTKRFPQDSRSQEQYRASLQETYPQLLYERFNIKGSQVSIDDYHTLSTVPLLIVTGTEDPLHINDDYKIVERFKNNAVNIDHYKLGERGIHGNGHMMMLEDNSDQILELILSWLEIS